MLTPILMCMLMSQVVIAQLNGEFWWLNGRFARERNIRPKFEKLSEHDTDESDKVIFRDNDLFIFHTHEHKKEDGKSDKEKPGNLSNIVRPNYIGNTTQNKTKDSINKTYYDNNREVIVFKIPIINNVDTTKVTPTNMPVIDKPADESLSQNICTFMKKNDCYRSHGLIHQQYGEYPTKSPFAFQFICCILPLSEPKNIESGKIYFPDTTRRKRSNTEEISVALQQRNVLLQRKYSVQRVKPATSVTRVVTDDYDDPDPYWNIKNKHVHNPNKKLSNAQLDYDDNNNQEYSTELPKPGLVGLYSDQAKPSTTFSFLGENPSPYGGTDDYDEEEEVPTFGYSTIDPRLGERKTKRLRKPLKLTSTTQQSSSDEITNNADSHTISYQSSPDFHVLHGFKLLNLFRNRSIITSKNNKKSINRNYGNEDSTDYVITKPLEANSEPNGFSVFDDEGQLFEGCGISDETMNYEEEKQIGSAEEGSHPWLALVVRTKRKQDILCYATLIHPRAALTSADCVYGTSSNDVTLIAGLWDLNDKSRSSQRAATIQLHAQYKPGSLANDLSLLHWMQPLKLGARIQPACLANPDPEESCFIFGWGGFDQAIRMLSRWQKASILSHRECIGRLSSRNGNEIPANAFCASVRSRGTVTGIGGPLICQNDGRQSTVGVAVWRDNVVVLLPAKEWAMRAAEVLNSD